LIRKTFGSIVLTANKSQLIFLRFSFLKERNKKRKHDKKTGDTRKEKRNNSGDTKVKSLSRDYRFFLQLLFLILIF
jgi:hypothetical protein